MNTFYLRVISSNKVFFDDKVTKFVLPLEDGEMAVLPHHENMIIATSIGEIRIDTPDGKKILGVVGEGFAQIVNNRVRCWWILQNVRRISTESVLNRHLNVRKSV